MKSLKITSSFVIFSNMEVVPTCSKIHHMFCHSPSCKLPLQKPPNPYLTNYSQYEMLCCGHENKVGAYKESP